MAKKKPLKLWKRETVEPNLDVEGTIESLNEKIALIKEQHPFYKEFIIEFEYEDYEGVVGVIVTAVREETDKELERRLKKAEATKKANATRLAKKQIKAAEKLQLAIEESEKQKALDE